MAKSYPLMLLVLAAHMAALVAVTQAPAKVVVPAVPQMLSATLLAPSVESIAPAVEPLRQRPLPRLRPAEPKRQTMPVSPAKPAGLPANSLHPPSPPSSQPAAVEPVRENQAAPTVAAAASQSAQPAPVVPPRSDAAYLNNRAPAYPALSRRLREEGRVLLNVHVLADGSVGDIRLQRSSGFERLDDAALAAVRSWKFVPARRGDEPVALWYLLPLSFSLDQS